MIEVKFITKGRGINELTKGLKRWQNAILPSNISKLGVETQNFMQSFIESHKKRPSGATPVLSKSINLDLFGGKGFGVGKISLLPIYWASINFGFAGMVGKRVPLGIFEPGVAVPTSSAFRDGRWVKGKHLVQGKMYSFISKKPISPMNYIESSAHFLSAKIDQIVAGLNKL